STCNDLFALGRRLSPDSLGGILKRLRPGSGIFDNLGKLPEHERSLLSDALYRLYDDSLSRIGTASGYFTVEPEEHENNEARRPRRKQIWEPEVTQHAWRIFCEICDESTFASLSNSKKSEVYGQVWERFHI